jgi:hypothetical protein
MPVEVSYDAEKNVLWRTISGDATLDELIGSISESLKRPDLPSGLRSVMDFRTVTSFGKPSDIRKYFNLIFQYKEKLKGIRVAVVVSDDVAYGLTRMLQAHTDRLPLEIGVFRDIDEATTWLGI